MFKNIIKSLRLQNNWTQQYVANLLNISLARYSHYETGKREPDYDMLKQFSKIYNVTIDYLLDNNIKKDKIKKTDILKNALLNVGIINKNEIITDKDIEILLNFISDNKKYIIKDTN